MAAFRSTTIQDDKDQPPSPPPSTSHTKMTPPIKAKHSSLLDLPAELRLKIYAHYFRTFTPQYTYSGPSSTCIAHAAPLFNTCKLIRHEAAEFYLARLKKILTEATARESKALYESIEYYEEYERGEEIDWDKSDDLVLDLERARSWRRALQDLFERELEVLEKDAYKVVGSRGYLWYRDYR